MVLSKQEQIQERREIVLAWKSQGLSTTEIANKLSGFGISHRTVARDLEHIRKEAMSNLLRQQQNIALEYQEVLSNFYQLRKSAWEWFNKLDLDNDTKLALYHTLEQINNDIMNLLAAGDMIRLEYLEEQKQNTEDVRKELDKMMEHDNSNSAVF